MRKNSQNRHFFLLTNFGLFFSGEPLSFGNCFTAFLCVIAGVCVGAFLLILEMLSTFIGVGNAVFGSYGVNSSGMSARVRTAKKLMDHKDGLIREMAGEIKTLREALRDREKGRPTFGGGEVWNWRMFPTRSLRASRLRL